VVEVQNRFLVLVQSIKMELGTVMAVLAAVHHQYKAAMGHLDSV
jgi:hypothetical protein